MKLHEIAFKRRFSVNFYRNLNLKMGEMSFYKDWVNDTRGDPYPLTEKTAAVRETVGEGRYALHAETGGTVQRLLGAFFPWYTYEICVSELINGTVGLVVDSCEGALQVSLSADGMIRVCTEAETHEFQTEFSGRKSLAPNTGLSVSFRTGGVSVYEKRAGADVLVCDLPFDMLNRLRRESCFSTAKVFVKATLEQGGRCVISRADWCISAGISQADMKPIRYEDGTPMIENGRVFLTMSARSVVDMYQCVVSWNPLSCDFRMEGAIFYDCGDGFWCGDVAASIIFDRSTKKWITWMCAFSHDHILARGISEQDPRFGINVLDVQCMEKAEPDMPRTAFRGFVGDEDPDLILVEDKWHLAICRLEDDKTYHYYHFVSDNPFDGFTFLDRTTGGEKTGGSFVRTAEGIVFVCGSDFSKRAVYDVYALDDFSTCEALHCDYDDGGFRGWGTVMLLPCGSRKRYVWMTFDRHNGSTLHNWSYGNIYVFDSATFV